MTPQNYWYSYLKKRGLKYSGKPSIVEIANLVASEFNEKELLSKIGSRNYLKQKKIKKVNKRESLKELYDKPCAYFIGSEKYEWVKIGSSSNLINRIETIQVSCPFDLKILAQIPSNSPKKTEKKLHYKFQHLRLRGEWFKLTNEITTFIENIKNGT